MDGGTITSLIGITAAVLREETPPTVEPRFRALMQQYGARIPGLITPARLDALLDTPLRELILLNHGAAGAPDGVAEALGTNPAPWELVTDTTSGPTEQLLIRDANDTDVLALSPTFWALGELIVAAVNALAGRAGGTA